MIETILVPIVKFSDLQSKIEVDISADQPSGVTSSHLMKQYLSEFPDMRSLVLTIKFFLIIHNKNDTHSGGIGSFVMQLMIISYLQVRFLDEKDARIVRAACSSACIVRALPCAGSSQLEEFSCGQ